ncbi:ATP-binding protein, partial [Staphylococcus aureus]
VAMNLFILAQERSLFDECNLNEIITPQVLKKTAKEDMQTIQPMMTAVRTNNIADMMKYEDIMINLDEVMLTHKRNTEIAGRIQEAFKERQN